MPPTPELLEILALLRLAPVEPGFVYFIAELPDGPIKIGYAISPQQRLLILQSGNPRPLSLLGGMPGGRFAERQLHMRFAPHRVRGEWFTRVPLLDELVAYWRGFNTVPRESPCCSVIVVKGRCMRCGARAA